MLPLKVAYYLISIIIPSLLYLRVHVQVTTLLELNICICIFLYFFCFRGDPDKCDHFGSTALHLAARNGHMNCISFLVSFGCNLWALDNDHHTAMDVSVLSERHDIVRFLDASQGKQATLNKKTVQKMKEKAYMEAERNIRKYEKIQEETRRQTEKEEKRREKHRDMINDNGEVHSGGKMTLRERFTLRLKGSSKREPVPGLYSNYTGASTGRKGTAKKISERKLAMNGDEFMVSQSDESGKRTINSVRGIRSSSEVMYVTNTNNNVNDSSSGRKPLHGVFDRNKSHDFQYTNGDSGIDSFHSAEVDDNDNEAGVFTRKGFGELTFLQKYNVAGALMSMPANHSDIEVNGIEEADSETKNDKKSKRHSGDSGSIGTVGSLANRMKDLPWNEDEVENLDDDDDESDFTPLSLFLAAYGLTEYINSFTLEKIDLTALMLLNEDDLSRLGLPMGPRKKMLDAVSKRQRVLDQPGKMADSRL